MSDEIPSEEIEKIKNNDYGYIVLLEDQVSFEIDEEDEDFDLLLSWTKNENYIYIGEIEKDDGIQNIGGKSIKRLINILVSICKLKDIHIIYAIPTHFKMPKVLREFGFVKVEKDSKIYKYAELKERDWPLYQYILE